MSAFLIITASFAVIQAGSVTKNLKLVKAEPELYCTEGWYPFGNLCYKGFKDKLPFEEAEKECVKLGGHLAAITSAEIQEYVLVYIIFDLKYWAYIGLRHPEDTSNASWTDGSHLEFRAWDSGEPSGKNNAGKGEHCVEMQFIIVANRLGKWNDVVCEHKLPYVCQKPKTTVPAGETAARDPTVCPGLTDGFRFGDSCYHLSSHKKPWKEAEKYCMEQYNGHLAAIKDIAAQTFFQYLMKTAANQDRMWIGLRLMPDEITLWTSGWYMGFTNWIDGSTHRKVKSEFCGSIMKSNGQWKIGTCEATFSYICEETSVVPPPRLTPTKTGLKCPDNENDWIDVGGDYCYIFQQVNYLSWIHANFHCWTKGGTLASIHSEAEVNMLKQFIMTTYDGLHIGLFKRRRSQLNEFEWADRSPVDYTRWNYGEPNGKDELCGEVMPWLEMKWNDISCDSVKGFICSVAKGSFRNNSSQKMLEGQLEEKCERFPTAAIVGVAVGVLLVIVLAGIMLYTMKLWWKARQELRMVKSFAGKKTGYRKGKIIPEHIYENIDGEI